MELISEPYWLADYTFSLGASVFLVGLLNLKMSNVIYALCFSNLILSLSYSPILTQWQDRKKKKKTLRKFNFCILDLQEIQG